MPKLTLSIACQVLDRQLQMPAHAAWASVQRIHTHSSATITGKARLSRVIKLVLLGVFFRIVC